MGRSAASGAVWASAMPVGTAKDVLRQVFSRCGNGIGRVYRGVGFSILSQIPSNAFYFASYMSIKEVLEKQVRPAHHPAPLLVCVG